MLAKKKKYWTILAQTTNKPKSEWLIKYSLTKNASYGSRYRYLMKQIKTLKWTETAKIIYKFWNGPRQPPGQQNNAKLLDTYNLTDLGGP